MCLCVCLCVRQSDGEIDTHMDDFDFIIWFARVLVVLGAVRRREREVERERSRERATEREGQKEKREPRPEAAVLRKMVMFVRCSSCRTSSKLETLF